VFLLKSGILFVKDLLFFFVEAERPLQNHLFTSSETSGIEFEAAVWFDLLVARLSMSALVIHFELALQLVYPNKSVYPHQEVSPLARVKTDRNSQEELRQDGKEVIRTIIPPRVRFSA